VLEGVASIKEEKEKPTKNTKRCGDTVPKGRGAITLSSVNCFIETPRGGEGRGSGGKGEKNRDETVRYSKGSGRKIL